MSKALTVGILVTIIIIIATPISLAQAQQPSLSPEAQRIIDIVQSNCEQITAGMDATELSFSNGNCVSVKYESPSMVVLNAVVNLDTVRSVDNYLVWQAVDAFRVNSNTGYSIDSIIVEEKEPNGEEYTIVMIK